MSKPFIYTADRIFTGEEWLINHAIVVENNVIIDLLPLNFIHASVDKHYECLVPAFIDIQIYGAAGKLFSQYPETDALFKLYNYCKSGGTANFLPTVATNTLEVVHQCIDAVKAYWLAGGKGCLGLHLEGPWINVEKAGAHVKSLIQSPTIEEVKALLEYGKDVIKMITLAPEVCSAEVLQLLKNDGIVISAGHSNATYQQATNAFNNGINTTTHLYNAMSGLQHREPGFVGAVFNHDTAMASIIPDGHHVDFAAVSVAKKIMKERLFIITDAVTETRDGYYLHALNDDKYISNGVLSGSSLTMKKAVQNLIEFCGVEVEEALRMASLYPAKVLGIDNELGMIKKGYKASFIPFD